VDRRFDWPITARLYLPVKWASAIGLWNVERSFEEAGCSCNPYRERMKVWEEQYKAEEQRLMEALYSSDLTKGMKELKTMIAEIDRAEHGPLDAEAWGAYQFLPVWLMDEIREEKLNILELRDKDVANGYATAWYHGWRPGSLRSAQPT
jgi:hypothetical protein